MATHTALEIVERNQVHDDLSSALAPFSYVFGTTARLGGQRAVIHSPQKMAVHHCSDLAADNAIAVVFGPEDRGLSNDDLRLCHELVNIPYRLIFPLSTWRRR
jgi:tRNA/rRNA methyltransferase